MHFQPKALTLLGGLELWPSIADQSKTKERLVFNFKKNLRHALVAGLMGCLGFANLTAQANADELTIGSKAPELDIEHWVQDGNGKFKPVTEFKKGNVYIVEFWATWCGPCIASMPHIVETQKKYADKGVQIVSISDEDLETVDKFLERKYKAPGAKKEEGDESGDEPKTYRELTSSYCLTTDPDRSSSRDYMEAAGQNGIPCAFIVGKDQKIEWIGHPMSMDKALADVVEDKWDRAAFAEEFAESQKMDLLMAKIMRSARGGKMDEAMELIDKALAETDAPQAKAQLTGMKAQIKLSAVMALAQGGKSEEALAALDELVEAEKDPAMKKQLGGFRVQVQMQAVAKLMKDGKTEEAMGELDKLIDAEKNPETKQQLQMTRVNLLMRDIKNPKFAEAVASFYAASKDNPDLINNVTWNLYEKFADGTLKDKDLLKASRAAAEQAAVAADPGMKAAILDTAAHYQFLDGDVEAALKTQTEAAKLAEGPMKEGIDEFLEELKKKAGK